MRTKWNCLLCIFGLLLVMSNKAAAQNPVTDWNNIGITAALAANQTTAPGSSAQAGSFVYMAYVHLAIYDAVNAIDQRHQPYGPELSAPPHASKEAATIAAAYYTLTHYFPDQAATLLTNYNAALAAIPDGSPKTEGIAIGQAAANLIIALRAGDGRGATFSYTWPAVPTPGVWIPTPPAFAAPATPWLSAMTPFTMHSASQFRPEPPPALTSSQWADDYNLTKTLGAVNSTVRTPEQTEIGLFWTDHSGLQYGRALRALAISRDLDISNAARLFATVYVSAADAAIGCWDGKYHYSFWRPVTAIRNGDIDGNSDTVPDSGWTPLGTTPNHPEYPAAHGCVTSSIANALKDFFKTSKVTLVVTSSVTNTTHTFLDTKDWVTEVEYARIYAGFHYQHSVVEGALLGRKVAEEVSKNFFQRACRSERNELDRGNDPHDESFENGRADSWRDQDSSCR
jgi:hypothetical protein